MVSFIVDFLYREVLLLKFEMLSLLTSVLEIEYFLSKIGVGHNTWHTIKAKDKILKQSGKNTIKNNAFSYL